MRLVLLSCLLLSLSACAPQVPPAPKVYFPPAPDLPRVQFLTYFASELDVLPEGKKKLALALGNTAPLSFKKATGLAFFGRFLYVVDSRNRSLWRFDLKNKSSKVFQQLEVKGVDGGGFGFQQPVGIVIDQRGYKYIADTGSGKIVVVDDAEQVVTTLEGREGFRPGGLAVGGGSLWVGDVGNHKILQFDTGSRNLLKEFGEFGEVVWPVAIALDDEGNLIVCDMGLFKVVRFSPDGERIDDFGAPGDRPGQFSRPKGVALAPDGVLHVVDGGFENVQMFTGEGRLLTYYAYGDPPANLFMPLGIAIGVEAREYLKDYLAKDFEADYIIAVANQFGPSRVNLYAFGRRVGADYSKYKTVRGSK